MMFPLRPVELWHLHERRSLAPGPVFGPGAAQGAKGLDKGLGFRA